MEKKWWYIVAIIVIIVLLMVVFKEDVGLGPKGQRGEKEKVVESNKDLGDYFESLVGEKVEDFEEAIRGKIGGIK